MDARYSFITALRNPSRKDLRIVGVLQTFNEMYPTPRVDRLRERGALAVGIGCCVGERNGDEERELLVPPEDLENVPVVRGVAETEQCDTQLHRLAMT